MDKPKNSRVLRLLSVLPAITISILWAGVHASFVFFELGPGVRVLGLWQGLKAKDTMWMLIAYHLCSAMMLVSLWRASRIGPGSVPRAQSSEVLKTLLDEYLEERGERAELFGEKAKGGAPARRPEYQGLRFSPEDFKLYVANRGYRFCAYCWVLKPHRAHHCRQCGDCRLKMDHHCNWVEVCVGLRNYKAFLLFIFYAWVAVVIACLRLLTVEGFARGLALYLRASAQLFAASLAFLLSILNLFHLGVLTCRNRSTIEFCEEKEDDGAYSRGPLGNWLEVFGKNPLLWLLPTAVDGAAPDDPLLVPSTDEESLFVCGEAAALTAKRDFYR